jgi:hypothetical protein
MRFFSRGSNRSDNRGNRGNRGRGPNAFWQRGRNKRMIFSIHFDANSKEFNQLVHTGYLNLVGHPTFHPPQPPVRPHFQPNDLQPHPSIVDIPNQPHVQAQPPVNDGWKNAPVNPPSGIGHWPTMSLPLPPPPPLLPVHQLLQVASHVHSPQLPKKYKALAIEPRTK